jgi:hypothetical protein
MSFHGSISRKKKVTGDANKLVVPSVVTQKLLVKTGKFVTGDQRIGGVKLWVCCSA